MITHSDESPEFEPDDPLAVILRPSSDYLGPPAGRYEAIRRRAARRRLVRAAVGVGGACAVAALVALPLRTASSDVPVRPTVPLAPPVSGSPSQAPTLPATPAPSPSSTATPMPSDPSSGLDPGEDVSGTVPTPTTAPTGAPSAVPTIQSSPSDGP
ncbi:hypothetical protein SLINC_6079 [Streptomyces lincolnensis]|uniref:Uncharacterized protein n=1 Tax=Streptomyces lincolnensis TaxID=1915 RepID=A0A1B1MIH8_STRLN|nr:hypothetical protein [Streptomyces lincolnensis]ANS68303.1 hypothetical protein SLINC_6079 [Streptomyces lincolnensis]AXG53493.1 hypothetical protein SLCG_2338 [Streptomyces lincolnensis]QMV09944.1 hypothetical protein GJU35_32675 [Streptomyces lincolnensis]